MNTHVASLGECLSFSGGSPVSWFALALFVIFAGFGFWIDRRPNFFGKRFFVVAHWALVLWLFAAAMELWSLAPGCKIFWGLFAHLGISLVPPAWFLFVYRYARGESGRPHRWQLAVLIGTALVGTAIAWTNPLHGLFYAAGTGPTSDLPGASIAYEHGPLFAAKAAALYLYILGSVAILTYCAIRATGSFRMHFVLLIILTLVPTGANAAYVLLGFELGGFDPTPFVFSVILVVYALLISGNQMFQTSAIAKDLIFESLPNPIVVVGRDGRMSGANSRAARTFGIDPEHDVLAANLPGMGPLVGRLLGGEDIDHVEDVSVGDRHFEVQVTRIIRPIGRLDPTLGWVLNFFDITARHRAIRHLESELESRGQALQVARKRSRRFMDEARTDPLTGLLNRRTLPQTFAAMRQGDDVRPGSGAPRPLLLVLIDIDHFKEINDRFGHAVGDDALVIVADNLRGLFRRDDRIFRVGGEEFLILMPLDDVDTLTARLDALRGSLAADAASRLPPGLVLQFTAGVAACPRDGTTLEQLYDIADHRLYDGKVEGRNRTVGPASS